MKKFTFSLESLLNLRDLEEQNAKTALAEVNARIERIKQQMQDLDVSINQAYSSWNGESGRRFSAMDRMGLSSQIADLKKQSAETMQLRQQAMEQRALAMDRLKEATRNRKVVTNLKEKRLHEHQAEALKQEANEIEDIFNARRITR